MKTSQEKLQNNELKEYQKLARAHGVKLPNFDLINKPQQYFAYSCKVMTYIMFILMIMIPLPYNTQAVHIETGTVFESQEMLAMFEVLMLSLALNFHYSGIVFYQLTYRDGIKLMRKMEKTGLVTSHISDLIITMLKQEQKLKEQDKRSEYEKTLEYINKKYANVSEAEQIKAYILELEKENKKIKQEMTEFNKIKKEVENGDEI